MVIKQYSVINSVRACLAPLNWVELKWIPEFSLFGCSGYWIVDSRPISDVEFTARLLFRTKVGETRGIDRCRPTPPQHAATSGRSASALRSYLPLPPLPAHRQQTTSVQRTKEWSWWVASTSPPTPSLALRWAVCASPPRARALSNLSRQVLAPPCHPTDSLIVSWFFWLLFFWLVPPFPHGSWAFLVSWDFGGFPCYRALVGGSLSW
jgi:hypothetical protein